MTEIEKLQSLFLQQPLQRRIGEIGVNLLNIHSFECDESMADFVSHLIGQSRKFIAWTLQDVSQETRTQLLTIDKELSRWQADISSLWMNANERKQICQIAKALSDRTIEMTAAFYEIPNETRKVAEPKP
jgi:cytochrome c553